MSTSSASVYSVADFFTDFRWIFRMILWVYGPFVVLAFIVNPSVSGFIGALILFPLWIFTTARKLSVPLSEVKDRGVVGLVKIAALSARGQMRLAAMSRRWSAALVDLGLTTDEGEPVCKPNEVHETHAGMELRFRIRSDRGVEQFQDVRGALARRLGFERVTITLESSGVMVVQGLERDPLGGIRYAVDQRASDWPVVIGRLSNGADATVNLRDAAHLAIQGATRSGKSVLTYGLLAPLAGREDVRVCGVDPSSVLLGPWADRKDSGPIALGSGAEVGAEESAILDQYVSVMIEVLREMTQRLAVLRTQGLDKFDTFDAERPLVVCVLEEFPGAIEQLKAADATLKPAERRLPIFQAAVNRVLREGAKVGVRVILLAQRMDASIVGGASRSQLGVRITLRVDNAEGVRMLHEQASSELIAEVPEFAQGRGLFQEPGSPARPAQFDLLDYSEYREMVTEK